MTLSSRTVLLSLLIVACTSGNPKSYGHRSTIHRILGRVTFCNGSWVRSGINEKTEHYWSDCMSVQSKGNESFISAVWRVYTCVLARIKGDGTGTMTLSEFSQIITAPFPDEIKKSINGLINKLGSTSGTENPWLTTKIKLTDYSNVDKIRAQYYEIEETFCKNGTDILLEKIISAKSWDTCSSNDEELHRRSSCCGNNTNPLDTYMDSPLEYSNLTTCDTVLETVHAQLNSFYDNGTLNSYLSSMCQFPCHLVEKSLITIEEMVQKISMNERRMRLIVNVTYPYIPVNLQQTLAGELTKWYNETRTMEMLNSFVEFYLPNNLMESETGFLHSCIALRDSGQNIRLNRFACPDIEKKKPTICGF